MFSCIKSLGVTGVGGYEVSVAWKDGALTTASIKAQHDGTLRIRCKDKITAKELTFVSSHDGINEYEVTVKAGQTIILKK